MKKPFEAISGYVIWLAPLVALFCGFLAHHQGLDNKQCITISIATWTALWWIFEAVPLGVTSLLPLALVPMFGILSADQVAQSFGSKLVLLLMGGFLLSGAMEKSGAHRRIALMMVNLCGGSGGKRLVLGFMIASSCLSMWISNSATTLMMLPIALAVLENAPDPKLRIPLLLGIAYAASIGGMGTPIGTTPNLVFMDAYATETREMSFASWMGIGVPITICLFVPIWLWLTRSLAADEKIDLPQTGTWRIEERRTLIIFGLTALAWITRQEPFGGWRGLTTAWSKPFQVGGVWIDLSWLNLSAANDASVAMIAVVAMFCIGNGKGKEKLLDWKTARAIPWEMLILVGAGICLGKAFSESGLSGTIAGQLEERLTGQPLILVMFGIALVVTFLTEMTSNTATANLLMPILGAAAEANGFDAAAIMVPATISASCAFMLPVATIPNAVVFGTGEITIWRMAKEGFALNLLGAFVVTIVCYILLA